MSCGIVLGSHGPSLLKSNVSLYKGFVQREEREEVCGEVDYGILVAWKADVRNGVLPLMAVIQSIKHKVRPLQMYVVRQCENGGKW